MYLIEENINLTSHNFNKNPQYHISYQNKVLINLIHFIAPIS